MNVMKLTKSMMSTFQGLSCGWNIGIFKFKELGNIVISALSIRASSTSLERVWSLMKAIAVMMIMKMELMY